MDINNFRVSPIGDSLEIWVEVPEGPYYENITIEKIAIQDHQHYTTGYPANPQVELTINNPIDTLNIDNPKKVIKRLLFNGINILGINNTGMYFLYVKQVGIPAEEAPCICNREITIAVAANLYPIYNKAIKLINQDCFENQDALVDIYLKKAMFIQAIELEEYNTAVEIFDGLLYRDIQEGQCLDAWNSPRANYNPNVGCNTCR